MDPVTEHAMILPVIVGIIGSLAAAVVLAKLQQWWLNRQPDTEQIQLRPDATSDPRTHVHVVHLYDQDADTTHTSGA